MPDALGRFSTTAPVTKHKVLLVDDHPIVREGIGFFFAQQPDLEVVGAASDARSAVRLVRERSPDVVIVDIALGRDSGLHLIEELRREWPGLAILALSMHDEQIYAERALRAGALGYIMKQEATQSLLSAVHCVLAGELYVSRAVGTFLVNALRGRPSTRAGVMQGLSNRELEVFRLVGMGLGTREIALQLHISVKTVEAHRAHIKEKLRIDSAPELVIRAAKWLSSEFELSGDEAERAQSEPRRRRLTPV
jgi:DNA-binding NarL/FixJ family response regulator